jgi:hypothetical protein
MDVTSSSRLGFKLISGTANPALADEIGRHLVTDRAWPSAPSSWPT